MANEGTMPVTEAFLNARKMRDPESAHAHAQEMISNWQAIRVRTALGITFKQASRVWVQKPWWMPRFLFRRLMASILIETKNEESRRRG